MCELSGEVRKDVGQNQGVWELFRCKKSEHTYFIAQHTLLHVCHFVGAVFKKGTTIIARKEV